MSAAGYAKEVVRHAALSRALAALGPLFALLMVLGVFTAINGWRFLHWPNLQTMVADASIVAIAALGMTLVIIGGGIDLSTGSLVALSSIMCAKKKSSMTICFSRRARRMSISRHWANGCWREKKS